MSQLTLLCPQLRHLDLTQVCPCTCDALLPAFTHSPQTAVDLRCVGTVLHDCVSLHSLIVTDCPRLDAVFPAHAHEASQASSDCLICCDARTDTRMLPCGHSSCRGCIRRRLVEDVGRRCFFCNQRVDSLQRLHVALQEVIVSGSAVTGAAVQELVHQHGAELRVLHASSLDAVTELVLESRALQQLHLPACRSLVTLTATAPLLKRLSVRGCHALSLREGWLRCPALEWLDLSGTHVSELDVAATVGSLHCLRVLQLNDCAALSGWCPPPHSHLAMSLRCLSLDGTGVRDDGLARLLAACELLVSLSASGCAQLRAPVLHAERLESLALAKCAVLSRPAIACPVLRDLDLGGCPLLRHPRLQCPALLRLRLSKVAAGSDMQQRVRASCPALERVHEAVPEGIRACVRCARLLARRVLTPDVGAQRLLR